ncbi:MAG: hypothetical protein K0S09_1258 [Sphingobacteriaceae bacterium]|jgi:signal transduction histidine kinase|nr:hypothetical protein [Sphingobacteriaceae bacterium]
MRFFAGFLSCVLLLFAGGLRAQSSLMADSTYKSIQKIKDDSVRIDKSLEYLAKLTIEKSNKASALKESMLKHARQQSDNLTIGRIFSTTGFSYLSSGSFDLAYAEYIKALPLLNKYGKPKQKVRVHQDLMWIQFQMKDYDKAEKNLQTALNIAEANNLKDKQAEVYNMFGILYDSQLQYEKAVSYYSHALEINKKYGTRFNEISSLVNLAISQRRLKRYSQAMENLHLAKAIADSVNNEYFTQSILQNIGELAYDMKDYDTAEKYILLAAKGSKNNPEPVLRTGLLALLKNIYKQKGDYKNAFLYSDSLAKINNTMFAKDKTAQVRDLEAKYQSQLKDQRLEAQVLASVRQQQELDLKKRLLQLSGKENEIQALELLEKRSQLQNEQLKQASLREKEALLYQLKTKDKNKQIARQQDEINTSANFRFFLIIGLVFVLLLAILSFYSYGKTNKLNKIISAQKHELEVTGQVKDRIFSVVSHDMRAPINTLIAFTQLLEYGEVTSDNMVRYAAQLKMSLNHTSVLMDNLLNWASSQMQGFKPNIVVFDVNLIASEVINSLQTQATVKEITIQNKIPSGTLISADINMTQLVLRNLISNSVKYSHANGNIVLNAKAGGEKVNITVTDKGTGMPGEIVQQFNSNNYLQFLESTPGTNKEKGTGLGLVLCKNFTTLMCGEISVKSEKGSGSKFSVVLPKAA